jgi:hypothetical protein
MKVRQSIEWELAGETEVLEENLSQYQFICHVYFMTWPHDPRPCCGKRTANRLNYDQAIVIKEWYIIQ